MIKLFLERLTLLSGLTALVMAAFWPHIGPKLKPILDILILRPLSKKLKLNRYATQGHRSKQTAIIQDHPKFSGRTLKRMTSEKESLRFAHRSFEGFGQSPLSGNPSFSLNLASLSSGHPTTATTRGQFGGGVSGGGGAAQTEQSSTVPLTIFTASIIVLIIYIMMKTLTGRFSNQQIHSKQHYRATRSKIKDKDGFPYWEHNKDLANDFRSDKRKLARMSREEKARELILRHGGKNVSSAIRFLVTELEKQKQLLYENLSGNFSCSCYCHANQPQDVNSTDDVNELATKGERQGNDC